MTPEEQSQHILKTYTQNAPSLPLGKVGHFFERAYNATGDKKYLSFVAEYVDEKKRKGMEKTLLEIRDPNYSYEAVLNTESASPNAKRNNKRKLFYAQHPKLTLLHRLTNDAFFLKKLGVAKAFGDIFEEALLTLKEQESTARLLTTEEGIVIDSSYSANTLFHLRMLGVIDLTPEFLEKAEELYATGPYVNPEILSSEEIYSAFYTLTHIVIAASDFYDKTPEEDFSWIFSYFEKHIALAKEKLSLDILTEIALSYRICQYKKEENQFYREYFEHVTKTFSLERPDDIKYLDKKEHTSSIILLLFSPYENFFPGPNLSSHPLFT